MGVCQAVHALLSSWQCGKRLHTWERLQQVTERTCAELVTAAGLRFTGMKPSPAAPLHDDCSGTCTSMALPNWNASDVLRQPPDCTAAAADDDDDDDDDGYVAIAAAVFYVWSFFLGPVPKLKASH